jgi:hypothetical protein
VSKRQFSDLEPMICKILQGIHGGLGSLSYADCLESAGTCLLLAVGEVNALLIYLVVGIEAKL